MRICCVQAVAGGPQVLVRKAHRSAELRAASYVRAHSFGNYPADRSEYARRSHIQMTADDAWEQMEQGQRACQDGTGPMFFTIIASQQSIADDLVSNGMHIHIPHRVRPFGLCNMKKCEYISTKSSGSLAVWQHRVCGRNLGCDSGNETPCRGTDRERS